MSDITEIKSALEQLNPALVALRGEVDEIKGSVKDVITQEKFDRMAADVTAGMQRIQDEQLRIKAAMNRPGGGDDAGADREVLDLHQKRFEGYLRHGVVDGFTCSGSTGVEIKTMSTDSNPDGGYLVRPQLSQTIIDRVFESSPVRALANVEQVESSSLEVLIDDEEPDGDWVGERENISATDQGQIYLKNIAVHELAARPKASLKMLEDGYVDVESWLTRRLADKFARMQSTAFVTGDGVGKPKGFMTYPAWANAGVYERNKIEQVNLGASGGVTADGLIALQNSLPEFYQGSAVWGMKRSTFGKVLQQKGSDSYFFSPVLLRDGQASLQLLGRPVVFMDDIQALAVNSLSVVYADFSRAYTIADRISLQILRDPYSDKRVVEFYARMRVGGDVTSFDRIKIGKAAA